MLPRSFAVSDLNRSGGFKVEESSLPHPSLPRSMVRPVNRDVEDLLEISSL